MNPDDVIKTIGYSKTSNASKTCFALAYEWFAKTNGIQWKKPKFKQHLGIPIIPTTSQVNKILSASTVRYATIYTLMIETAVEGEELHETNRKQYDPSQRLLQIKGLKGHGDNNYPLKPHIAQMLEQYLAKNPQEYPFPRAKSMGEMWRDARNKAAKIHNDPTLKNIPMKNLRNYSGAQYYLSHEKDFIGTMRHMRHQRPETTMHYLRAINLDVDPEYDTRIATTKEEVVALNNAGYTYIQTLPDNSHIYRKRK